MTRPAPTAPAFAVVLGLASLGQAWVVASRAWGLPLAVGPGVLAAAAAVWAMSLGRYAAQAAARPGTLLAEFRHATRGPSAALPGISTMLVGVALLPHWRAGSVALVLAGLAWQLAFSLWHAGGSWQDGRAIRDTAPNIYLPTVAGNFTAAGALGALGWGDWGWLFFGAGICCWLALESILAKALWSPDYLPVERRALLGIHLAPPAVASSAWLLIAPGAADRALVLVWGYALFQILIGLRLMPWLLRQPFDISYWSYTFGVGSFAVSALKLAELDFAPARVLAPVAFATANALVLALTLALGGSGIQKLRAAAQRSPPAVPAGPRRLRTGRNQKAEPLSHDSYGKAGNVRCR